MLRRHLASLLCLLVGGLVGVVAIADHRDKQARIDRAELAEWYCTHTATRCGGASSDAIERHWNERELGYEVVCVLLGGAALARFGLAALGRSRAMRVRRS